MPKLRTLFLIVALIITSCGDEKPAEQKPVPNSGDEKAPTASAPVGKCNSTVDGCIASIQGSYQDAFNTTHTISQASWVSSHATFGTSTYSLITVDNPEKRLIAQNSASNGYAPSKFSAFDWTYVGSQLYYCQVAFDKDTQAEAEAMAKADASDPTKGGCGGFPWSALN